MDMLQVVVEPRRREILRLLWDRELSVGEVASRFPVSFAAVSLHLGVLRQAGLSRGTWSTTHTTSPAMMSRGRSSVAVGLLAAWFISSSLLRST